ncbi:KCNH6 [Symbiodinium sp. KB8]|nr:KCNH6 [Symbiodinium sp. KB8]
MPKTFQDLIAELGTLQTKLLEAHMRELQAHSVTLEPSAPASCPPQMEVRVEPRSSGAGAPEKRFKGRLAPVVHKFLLARRLGHTSERRLSEERESATVRQALMERRQSISATDRVALAMRDAAAFEEAVRKEATVEVDRFQLRASFDIGDEELVDMKRRCITKQSSELVAGYNVKHVASAASEQGPTPAEVQEERMLNSWQLFPIHPPTAQSIQCQVFQEASRLGYSAALFCGIWTAMDCVLRARAPEQYALLLVRVNSTRIYWQWYCADLVNKAQMTCTIYWTVDIPVSMLTATYRNGKLVTSYYLILYSYSRTWMPIDFLLVSVDWVATVANMNSADTLTLARTMRTGRILRMLRLARLLRVVKLKRLFDDLKQRMAGEIVTFMINVVQLFVSTMLLTHVLACVWYWLGSEEEGWVYTEGLYGQDLGTTYLQSMQWSLSRLHPISLRDNMKLRLPQERMFSLVASFGSLLFSSIFISYVTNTMAKLARMWKERSRKLGAISDYAATHRINAALTVRLKKYIDEREEELGIGANAVDQGSAVWVFAVNSALTWLRINSDSGYTPLTGLFSRFGSVLQERVKWKASLQVLEAALPEELLRVLYHTARTPTLVQHDLFSKIKISSSHAMEDLCYEAVHEQHILAGDAIFEVGAVASSMYMCESGKLRYSMDVEIAGGRDSIHKETVRERLCCCRSSRNRNQVTPHDGLNKNRDSSLELSSGSWISEHALWTSWQHTGRLSGTTDSQILAIKSEDFGRVVQQDLPTFCDVVIYARYFIHEMNQTVINTDLPPDQMPKRSRSRDGGAAANSSALHDSAAFHDLLATPVAGS